MKVQASVTQATLDRQIRSALVQAANAAKCKQSYLAVVYRRFAARRGHKGNSGSCSPHPDGALSHAAQNSPIKTWEQAILISVNSSALCTDCNTELNNLAINSNQNLSPLRLLTARFSKQVYCNSRLKRLVGRSPSSFSSQDSTSIERGKLWQRERD